MARRKEMSQVSYAHLPDFRGRACVTKSLIASADVTMRDMKINSEADIQKLVQSDQWMMDVLTAADELDLPDWWIGAGFLRNKIWDAMEDSPSQDSRDVDLVYFDRSDMRPETDWAYDEYMKSRYPFAEWEVRNQARMHYKNKFEPYASTRDGISHWVETATCVAVKKEMGELAFLWCHGVDDILAMVARPIEQFRTPDLLPVFYKRIEEKGWVERWPHLLIKIG